MSEDDEPSGVGDWSMPAVEPPYEPSYEPSYEPAPPPNLNVPRRTPASGEPVSALRAMAGALVAVAGVLLGIGALLWATDAPKGDPSLQASRQQAGQISVSPPPAPAPANPTAAPMVAAARTSPSAVAPVAPAAAPRLALTVLNNSTRNKLADRAAAQFRAGGWPIRLTGNFTGRIQETTVYYAPGQLASAQRLQQAFPGITRVLPRFESLPGSGLTVVLTRSYDA